MNRLKLSIDKELDVMTSLEITAEEWLFIQLIFLYLEGDQDSMFKYFSEAKKSFIPLTTLESLKEKEILDKSYIIPKKGESFDPGKIKLSEVFLRKYFKFSGEMGIQLLDEYPLFITSGNRSFPMKNIAKHFRSLEDFSFAYGKAISFKKDKHEEIIELIKWAKENNAIHFSLAEFVISRKWLDLEKMKSGELKNSFIPTFDNSELI